MKHSRRGFLRQTAAGMAATAVFTGLTARNKALAQTSLTPEAALQLLADGNKRFVEGRMNSFGEDLGILKAKSVDKQEPFAAVLSCGFARARGTGVRPKHWTPLRHAGSR